MRVKETTRTFVGLLVPIIALLTAFTTSSRGDSIYGTVTDVQRADLVVFAYDTGAYTLRLVGITVPQDTSRAAAAADFVRTLVLQRPARMRFEGRLRTGEM